MADEDGLSWLFELDADTKGGTQMLNVLKSVDNATSKTDAGLKKLAQSSHQAAAAHDVHAKHAHNAATALGQLKERFPEIAKLVGEIKLAEKLWELPEKIHELGSEMLTAAAHAERTAKAFDLVFGPEVGKQTLEYIESIGKYTEFTRDQLKGAALDLAKVGFEGEGLSRALAASLDIASFSPNAKEGQAEALSALERIKNSGMVNRRMLKPLGISEQDFFKELTARTGKGRKELKKEMDAGTLDANQSLEALYTMITRRTHKDLGGAGVDMGKTMEATLTHLRELPERYFEKLSGSAGFKLFAEHFSKVLDDFDPDSPKGKRIFAALEETFNFFASLISKIDLAGIIVKATEALGDFEIGIATIMSYLPGETGEKGKTLLGEIFARKKLKMDTDRGAALMGTKDFEDDMKDLDAAAASGLLGEKSKVYNAAAAVGDAAKDGVRDKLEIHSPSVVFEDLGAMSAAGFGKGLRGGMDDAYAGISAPSLAARAGLGGGVTVHAPISISIGAHGGDASAQEAELVSRLRAVLPSELQSAFEQIAGEAGT